VFCSPVLLAPVNLTSIIVGSAVTLSWEPAASGAVPTTYIVEAGSFSGGSDLAVFSTDSVATTITVQQVPTGTYFVRVRAGNSGGTSPPSNEVVAVVGTGAPGPSPEGVPGPPSRLAISVSGSTASFVWNPPTSGGPPTAYLIEAGSSPGLSNLASFSTQTPGTSLSVGNVPAGTYFVRVRGQNAAGTGAPSNEAMLVVSGTGPCSSPPSAPSGLTFGVTGSTVSLNWNASAGSPTSYRIAAGSSSGSTDIAVFDTGTTATSLSATVGGGTYFVRVLGQNACGTSAPSNEVVIAIP